MAAAQGAIHAACQCIYNRIAYKDKKSEALIRSLASRLHSIFFKKAKIVTERVFPLLGVRKQLPEGFADELRRILSEGLADIEPEMASRIRQIVEAAFLLGSRQALSGTTGVVVPSGMISVEAQAAIDFISRNSIYWIKQNHTQQLGERISSIVQNVSLDRHASRYSAANALRNALIGQFERQRSYYEILSAAAVERSRNFGRIAIFEEMQILEVEVWNPAPVSLICNRLAGTRYPIERVVQQRDDMLNATNPEDVKRIAPWPNYDDIRELSDEEIMNSGVITPPYHARCKSELIAV